MKKLDITFWILTLLFVVSGLGAISIVLLTTTIDSLLQFLALSIVLIIFTTRVIVPKFQSKSSQLTYIVELTPISLFIHLLILSTGGLSSPFVALTHLFAIAMAFLVSTNTTIVYEITTVFYLIAYTFLDPIAKIEAIVNPVSIVIYSIAYIAILPFSAYISKIYHLKESWVNQLSQMLATSKKQEENLLKNIEHPVLAVTKDLKISMANSQVKDKVGYSQIELLGKNFNDIFKFKDKTGKNINFESLPLLQVMLSKNETQLNEIQINTKEGNFLRINLKIAPVIDHNGNILGLLLILKEFSQKDLSLGAYYNKVAQKFTKIEKPTLEQTARDLLLLLSLDTGIEGQNTFLDVSEIIEREMYFYQTEAKKKNVTITAPGLLDKPVAPKGKVFMPQKKGAFSPVYVLANKNLLTVATSYIIKTILSFAPNGCILNLQLNSDTDIVKFEITTNVKMSQDKINLLNLKFFNEFLNADNLSNLTGLEIAVAEKIFNLHGGSLNIEEGPNGVIVSASLLRHEPKSGRN